MPGGSGATHAHRQMPARLSHKKPTGLHDEAIVATATARRVAVGAAAATVVGEQETPTW